MGGALRLSEIDRALKINDAAKVLGISRDTIYRLMRSEDEVNKINFVFVGKTRRIKESEIERYLRENKK